MNERPRHLSILGVSLLALALLALAAAPADAAPPKGKHYAVTMMLANPGTGEVEPTPACLSFSADEMCSESGECGPWEFINKQGPQNEWHGTLDFIDEGTPFHVEARGVTERKGPGSSIGGTFRITVEGQELNAGFGGTEMTRAECLEFGTTDD